MLFFLLGPHWRLGWWWKITEYFDFKYKMQISLISRFVGEDVHMVLALLSIKAFWAFCLYVKRGVKIKSMEMCSELLPINLEQASRAREPLGTNLQGHTRTFVHTYSVLEGEPFFYVFFTEIVLLFWQSSWFCFYIFSAQEEERTPQKCTFPNFPHHFAITSLSLAWVQMRYLHKHGGLFSSHAASNDLPNFIMRWREQGSVAKVGSKTLMPTGYE